MLSASSAKAINCSKSNRLRRSFWNGALARRSSTDRFHNSVHEIAWGLRRSFKKYSTISGGMTHAARIKPAMGVSQVMESLRSQTHKRTKAQTHKLFGRF